jgi:hypothetical protein
VHVHLFLQAARANAMPWGPRLRSGERRLRCSQRRWSPSRENRTLSQQRSQVSDGSQLYPLYCPGVRRSRASLGGTLSGQNVTDPSPSRRKRNEHYLVLDFENFDFLKTIARSTPASFA